MQIMKYQHDKDHTSYTLVQQMQNKNALITKADTITEITNNIDHSVFFRADRL